MFKTRFSPMTAKPIKPISALAAIPVTPEGVATIPMTGLSHQRARRRFWAL
jgi:hypothetical protein